MTGLIGFLSGYYAMLDCDVLLMLGADFPCRQFYPRGAGVRIAQVDIRPERIGRRVPLDFGVVGDVHATLDALVPLIKEKRDRGHLDQAVEHYRKARKGLDELAVGSPGKRLIHPPQVAKATANTPPQTPSSPAMSACRQCGPRASGDERQAAADRICAGMARWPMRCAHDWRAGRVPGRQVISLSDLARSNLWT
jgi:Thiamine pyrophosphate enzyme, central domain